MKTIHQNQDRVAVQEAMVMQYLASIGARSEDIDEDRFASVRPTHGPWRGLPGHCCTYITCTA